MLRSVSTVLRGLCRRVIPLCLLLLCAVLHAGAAADSLTVGKLTDRYVRTMQAGEYADALEAASMIRDTSRLMQDVSLKMLADSYIGQAFLAMDEYDSAYFYLSESLAIWNGSDSLSLGESQYVAAYATFNGLGIYSIVKEMNYEKAVTYLLTGMNLAETRDAYYYYAVLGSNLVYAYNLRRDPAGLSYARDIYRYGKQVGNDYLTFTGSSTSAMMFYLGKDLDSALKYAQEAVGLADNFSDKASVYALYGDILHDRGNDSLARKYYLEAMASLEGASTTSEISIYLSYGMFLLSSGQYAEAVTVLEKGIALSDAVGNKIFTYRLYEAESEAYNRMGKYRQALESYRKFHLNSQEVMDIQRERALNDMTRKYENEKHEREIQQNNLTIVKKDKALITALFVILLILAVLGMTYLLYRHKNRMYARIARQYKDAIDKEKALEKKIDMLESQLGTLKTGPDAPPVLSDKNEELLVRLEALMKKEKIYREKNLTRDKVAALLGTNRTYLSQVINERTGMSFVHYVNSYRIDEALELLSDPENDTPLKAISLNLGFSSLTTFYTLFQKKVGMTPAKYREEVRALSNSTNCQNR